MATFAKDYKKSSPMEPHRIMCIATGCPMRGSMSSTGGENSFMCAPHFQGQPDEWPRITEALRESLTIRMAIDEILKIDEISWRSSVGGFPPKSQMMERFFDDVSLKPQGEEFTRKSWYEYRLRNELMFRAGLSRKPKVRIV